MPTAVSIQEFLQLAGLHPVIDVRTPAEFAHGHIPEAYNIPLFSNEERAIVGTLYKQEGRQIAIKKGLELIGPKMAALLETADKIKKDGVLLVHCWRGGMRSSSLAWLLELYGYKVFTLKGGYKFYRRLVLETFRKKLNLMVLGGKTGSGKTLILQRLKELGEQVIDLEKLASHKGSSFGAIGEEKQPTQEQFENNLAYELLQLHSECITWVEDESHLVGNKVVPVDFWDQMRVSNTIFIDLPQEQRAKYLVAEYGKYPIELLKEATLRISKRLGGLHTKQAMNAFQEGDLKTACEINLIYYDKAYMHGLTKRDPSTVVKKYFDELNVEHIVKTILNGNNTTYSVQ